MARAGIYKNDVKRARDALLERRIHPSVDAVRIALGNTGSKTTIHKYLKEIEEEDGVAGDSKSTITAALQDLVAQLSAKLQEEANVQIDTIRAEQQAQQRSHTETLTTACQEANLLRATVQRLEQLLSDEQAAHARTREVLHQETVARHTAEQHAVDLKERLAENDAHRQSLEDKHRHARESLEHYRSSVKEQRDQDQRRHEHQVQQLQAELRLAQQAVVVKQEDVTRLNQDGARLVSDLAHAQKGLYDAQSQLRHMEQKLETLKNVEQRATRLADQLQDKERQVQSLTANMAAATAQAEALATQHRALELELVTTQARLDAQRDITDGLRQYVMKGGSAPPLQANVQPPAE